MKTIAVIEDNADNRLLVQAILEDLYEVAEFVDGASGLEGIRASHPDLVLLDISLPGMNGEDVLSAIRADADLRDLPVLALTAHAMSGDRQRFLEQGFDDYIAKPIIDEDLLIRAIERQLHG